MRQLVALGWAAFLAAALWIAAPVTVAQEPSADVLAEPGRPSDGLVVTGRTRRTGAATFARARGAGLRVAAPPAASAADRARAFVARHGAAFGLPRAASLRLTRASARDAAGMEHVRLQQTVAGVPVTAGEMVVHLRGAAVVAAQADLLDDLAVDLSPSVSAEQATSRARDLLSRLRGETDAAGLTYSTPRLEVFNLGILQDGTYPTRLAWSVEAVAEDTLERIWVDAHAGSILLHFDQLTTGRQRRVHDANYGSTLPGTLRRTEGGAPTGNFEIDAAYDFSGDTYDYFFSEHGRDSYDNAGALLRSSVRYCPSFLSCPYQNAFWNGTQMVYGEGLASADDVAAHELTHAVTQYEANLFYYVQSGALNESYSDIFGEAVDLWNGRGNDSPAVRWQIGEDLPASIGVIRDMATPTLHGDPGKMSDPEFHTNAATDNGGVHHNSGVPNHAFALMVDGGTYNGYTIAGIGLTAAAKIHYRALTVYLTSGSNFYDNYQALQQSCADLLGVSGITSATCVEVTKALDAVEMGGAYPSNVPAPGFCPAGQTPVDLFADDFENAPAQRWGSSALAGSGAWLIPDTGWATSGTQMAGLPGYDSVSDTALSLTAPVTLPPGARLQFRHAYVFEQGVAPYDGGVIEYSVTGGASWLDAGSLITAGASYGTTPISTNFGNPLAGRLGFSGNSFGYTASQLDLSSLAGSAFRFRYRAGTDIVVGRLGWYVDDVRIYTCAGACSYAVAPASQSFPAEGGAGSITVTASTVSCGWTATSPVPWITMTGSGSGTGSGSLSYTVASNPTAAPRSATVTVGGQSVSVNQAAGVPPSVSLITPNGGETLFAGTPFTIQWSADGATAFDVTSSIDDGVTYTAVPGCTGLPSSARSCVWSTPGPATAKGRVRVTAHGTGGTQVSDASAAAVRMTTGAASITVTFPNTGVSLGLDSTQVITWKHNLGSQSWVRIELSRDGGVTYPEVLAAAHQNTSKSAGSFDWRVTGPSATGVRIRVAWTGGPASDASNASAAIAPVFLTLAKPSTGSSWGFGTTQRQVWATNLGARDLVQVQLSTTGTSGPYTTLPGGHDIAASAKKADVLVPALATAQARVRIRWTNPPAGVSADGVNPGHFSLAPPFVTLTAPAAGQVWQIGTAKTITWSSNLGLGQVEIRLSKDGGSTYPVVVAAATPSDGSHPVTVDSAWGPQTTTRIAITSLTVPGASSTSPPFSVQP